MVEQIIFGIVFAAFSLFLAAHGVVMVCAPDTWNVFSDWWSKATGLGPPSL